MSNHRLNSRATPAAQTPPEPVVVSFSRAYQVPGRGGEVGELAERVSLILAELAATVRQGGGFIGHIKSLVAFDQGGSLGLSVVRDRVDRQEINYQPLAATPGFKVAVTAIVYGYAREELTRLLNLGLAIGLPNRVFRPAPAPGSELKPIQPLFRLANPTTPSLGAAV